MDTNAGATLQKRRTQFNDLRIKENICAGVRGDLKKKKCNSESMSLILYAMCKIRRRKRKESKFFVARH
jgi:hypothetical protein